MLKDVVILDLSQYLPGPFATFRLSQLGAEVIKIESPHGDLARFMDGKEESALFLANNYGKKSVQLDLKNKDDIERFYALVKTSDVVIESFRPGVAKKLGVDYDTLLAYQPALIYCSLSGYGQTGELSTFASHDLNYLSVTGILSQMKDKTGRPIHPTTTFADLIGGMYASEMISAALFHREKSKKGCYLDLALTDSLTSFMNTHLMIYHQQKQKHGVDEISGAIINYGIYETKDGRFVSLAAFEHKFWERFCLACGKEEWIDAYFTPTTETNVIFKEVKAFIHAKTLKEWMTFSMEVDCCLTPILEVNELASYPLHQDRKQISKDSAQRPYTRCYPFLNDESKPSVPPKLGEHQSILSQKI